MILDILIVLLTIASIYGFSDYSNPTIVVNFIKALPFGKFSYATNWCLFMSIAAFILYIVQILIKFRIINASLKALLTISLPPSILVNSIYWILSIRNPLNFREQETLKYNAYTPIFSSLCQHLFPLLGLFLIWIKIPISVNRRFHFVSMLINIGFIFVSICGYFTSKRWPYPFMARMSIVEAIVLFTVSSILISIIFEILISLEKIRRKKNIRKLIESKKIN